MNISKFNRDILGMIVFIASESVFFLLLVFAYINFHKQYGNGASASGLLDTVKTGFFSIALFSSSFTLWLAERAHSRQRKSSALWMLTTILLGAVFMIGQGTEYAELIRHNVTISRDMFGTTFFTLTGFHGLHVVVGLVLLTLALSIMVSRRKNELSGVGLTAVSMYWHFVDAVWVVVFSVVYLWRYS